MAAACDVPDEARAVVDLMLAQVEKVDPAFFREVGEPPLRVGEASEQRLARPGFGDPREARAFDASLGQRRSRLVDFSPRAPEAVDVVEPELVASDPGCHALFGEAVEAAFHARARLVRLGVPPHLALYVLPNALAVRFEESGTLLHLMHKWTLRTCLNAQREIYEASMDELAQVREVHPDLVRHVGPPCVVRNRRARPRCTEGSHFCGIPVWRSFPEVERRI
jgi:thymidylate synthase ThyX